MCFDNDGLGNCMVESTMKTSELAYFTMTLAMDYISQLQGCAKALLQIDTDVPAGGLSTSPQSLV